MITIFNRAELSVTFRLEEQSRIRQILADHKIDYYVKTINRDSPSPFSAGSRSRTGSFGMNPDMMYEYKIYVRKSDLDKARFLIRK